jgi:anti-sigma factor RsiW
METDNTFLVCSPDDIAAYIDCELAPARELELEAHLSDCKMCSAYLNEQKRFLRDLDASLKKEGDLDVPVNFARTVIANAESSVSGIRRPAELFNAIFICAGLLLFLLFATGADAGRLIQGFSSAVDQLVVVGAFFGRVAYSLVIGVVIIVRSLASQFEFGMPAFIALLMVLGVSALLFSQRIRKTLRA